MLAYADLCKFAGEKNLRYTAFATRNLLELAIWTEYCAKSENNAQRFLQDAVRDANGLMAVYNKMVALVPVPPESLKTSPAVAEDVLNRVAGQTGIEEFDRKFLPVSEAAKQISAEAGIVFSQLNILLSNLVHPTAFSVKTMLPPEVAEPLIDSLLAAGSGLVNKLLGEVAAVAPTVPA